jgi:exodeoxyribonuclease VII large subunit
VVGHRERDAFGVLGDAGVAGRRVKAVEQGAVGKLPGQRVLARGFALVRGVGDRPIRSAAGVVPGQALSLEFRDGRVAATAAGRAPRAKPAGTGQDDLFD